MRDMHWDFEQLQRTPAYVKRFCADMLGLEAAVQQQEQERANRRSRDL